MINEKMRVAINKQINAEMYSAYLYLSMGAWYESKSLPGFANWMRVQAQEEMVHAMKFFGFIVDRGGKVELMAIDGPPTDWASSEKVFEEVVAHEQKVTSLIHGLADLAMEVKDHATLTFLQWFINEQVEEEKSSEAVLEQVRMVGDNKAGLYMLDKELAARVFVPPAAGAAT